MSPALPAALATGVLTAPPAATQTPADAEAFPLAVMLAGRRVVLVGGGAVAARRAAAFAAAGARLRIVSPQLCPELELLLAEGHEWLRREFRFGDLEGAWLAHTATGDAAVDAEVAREAEWRQVFCIAAGHAATGSAAVPARARATTPSGTVNVAVTSGDPRRSVAVARHVQDELESGRAPLEPRRRR